MLATVEEPLKPPGNPAAYEQRIAALWEAHYKAIEDWRAHIHIAPRSHPLPPEQLEQDELVAAIEGDNRG